MTQLPRQILDSIVAVGAAFPENLATWVPDSTGLFYGHTVQSERGPITVPYLVTAEHVFSERDDVSSVFIAVNGQNGTRGIVGNLVLQNEAGDSSWSSLPGVDLAIIRVDPRQFIQQGASVTVLDDEAHCATAEEMTNINDGDRVLVSGFPMGLPQPPSRQYPVVRRGVIASIGRLHRGESQCFLIDSQIFPGNSGGPVFYWPSPYDANGPSQNTTMKCLGVVSSSRNTRTNGTLENYSVGEVVPVFVLDELIEEHLNRWPIRLSAAFEVSNA